jgi:hypothetical protein
MCDDKGYRKRPATKSGHNLYKRFTPQVSVNPQEWRLNHAKASNGSGFIGWALLT